MRVAVSMFLLFSAACSATLEGPSPDPTSTTPSLACNEQLVTEIILGGIGFAPLVERGLDDAPAAVLPSVTLVRTVDPDGAAASGEVKIADAPEASTSGGLTWRRASELAFAVTPELALQPGLYDVRVGNPAGAVKSLPGALLVVPRPGTFGWGWARSGTSAWARSSARMRAPGFGCTWWRPGPTARRAAGSASTGRRRPRWGAHPTAA